MVECFIAAADLDIANWASTGLICHLYFWQKGLGEPVFVHRSISRLGKTIVFLLFYEFSASSKVLRSLEKNKYFLFFLARLINKVLTLHQAFVCLLVFLLSHSSLRLPLFFFDGSVHQSPCSAETRGSADKLPRFLCISITS